MAADFTYRQIRSLIALFARPETTMVEIHQHLTIQIEAGVEPARLQQLVEAIGKTVAAEPEAEWDAVETSVYDNAANALDILTGWCSPHLQLKGLPL